MRVPIFFWNVFMQPSFRSGPAKLYLARHCTSIHVSPSLSVPSLARSYPFHCALSIPSPVSRSSPYCSGDYSSKHTVFIAPSLSLSLYFLPPSLSSPRETTFKAMSFIPQAPLLRCSFFLYAAQLWSAVPAGWTWDKCIRPPLQLLICCEVNSVCTEPQCISSNGQLAPFAAGFPRLAQSEHVGLLNVKTPFCR